MYLEGTYEDGISIVGELSKMTTSRRRLILIGLLVLLGCGAATGYWLRPDWFDVMSTYWHAEPWVNMFADNELPDGFTVRPSR